MKPVLIFRHVPHEGPGFLADFLQEEGIPFELIAIDRGDPIPETPASPMVFMGGPMSVNDPLPWIAKELELIQKAHDRNIPMLGHCLGGQLIAKALGGEVVKNPVPEIGWFEVERIDNPVAEAWLDGLPRRFLAFHWHGETFTLPQGAAHILRSDHCENQGFALGDTLALQCHVEMTAALVKTWAQLFKDEITPSPTVQSPEAMTADLDKRVAELQRAARVIYRRWIETFA